MAILLEAIRTSSYYCYR